MIHPSFTELIAAINEREGGDEPFIKSRYSIVIASAKRARQLIDGDEPTIEVKDPDRKPLSIAVEELYRGEVNIVPEGYQAEDSVADAEDEDLFEDLEEPEESEESEEPSL